MPNYRAPLTDMGFVLFDVWEYEKHHQQISAYHEFSRDLLETVLEEAAKLTQNLLQPLNQKGDQVGCRFEKGQVITPPGFREAYQKYCDAGWPSLTAFPEFGGQGLPHMLGVLVEEMQISANVSFSLYTGLTLGIIHAIYENASGEIKTLFLPKMIRGVWSGTMCLTEAHCGTDLGLLRTRAELNADGSYAISGTKIFITSGEHDLSENIIHLVLARAPSAPNGMKGISLFLVPKILVNSDGTLGERNAVNCGSIEHKMGIKASSTCVMNYDKARGFLIGELNQGMAIMFKVMNIERLSIGLHGLALTEVSYQNARAYAQSRLQGRASSGAKYPEKNADPIVVHPDVRRMLLTMRAFAEGARALAVWVARQMDYMRHSSDAATQNRANKLVQLFTPIVKAFFTDVGFENCNLGLQVLGGHGYISEWGMEQFVRDARISQIYEGANGIQALDLVKRKLIANEGQYLNLFVEEIQDFIDKQKEKAAMEFTSPLQQAITLLQEISHWFLDSARSDDELAASAVDYLHLFGWVALCYMWAKMAVVAGEKNSRHPQNFYHQKIEVARFFMQRLLPKIDSLKRMIKNGSGSLMALADEEV